MTRNTGTNTKSTTTTRTAARVAIAGMVVGAPLAIFAGSASAATPASSNNWDAVAQCESGGNWSTNTGNGFSGGLQFTPSTWQAYGGSGSAQGASKSEQIQVAERVLAGQGKGAWPVCGKALGSSNASSSSQAPVAKATTKSAPKASTSKSSSSKATTSKAATPKATTKSAPKASSSSSATSSSASSAPSSTGSYVVKAGDTLSTIAATHGVDGGYQAIFAMNQGTIQNPNLIFVGQHLAL